MEHNYKYNEIIRQLREEHNETQSEVAQILKTTQQQIYKYEKGIQEMTLERLKKICQHYKVSADYILGLPDNYARTREELANRKNK